MYLQKTFGRQKLDCHFDEEVFNFTLFMDDIVGREKNKVYFMICA